MASAASVSTARPPLGLAVAAVLLAAAAAAALLFWALPDPRVAAAFFAGALALGLPLVLAGRRGRHETVAETPEPALDRALLRAALDGAPDAAAVTDADGALIAANRAYEARFGTVSPAAVGS